MKNERRKGQTAKKSQKEWEGETVREKEESYGKKGRRNEDKGEARK